ncbi:hypothetical protein ACOMHN_011323 [Nucella lapillus]
MAFVTMVVTSWLLSVAGAEFSPGCSFSAGQCQYNVQLGHQGSCDTSGGSHCCDAIRGQVSGLADDVGTLKSQMSTLMSELTASKHNLTQVTGKLSEAEAATQQLLHTLAQKEAELNTTRSDLSQIMRSAKEEINTLRVNLTRVNSELNTCRASLGLPTTTSSIPDCDEAACVDVTPGGYSMRSFPRQARRGSGIAFITRNSLFEHATVTTEFPFDHNSFELVQLTLDGHHRVNFFCLYRPPPSKVNKLTDGMFFEEFSEILEHANVMGGKTVFLGDFNISWDRPAHPNTVKAVDLLDMFSLSQAVNFPTHRDGHTIDWCVFREEELILRSVSRGPSLTSDHMPVMCYLDIAKPASTPVFQTVRNLRAIDKSQFHADGAAVFHNQPPATVEQLEAHLRAVLDVHAPAIRRLPTQRRSSPWYSAIAEELRSLKQKRPSTFPDGVELSLCTFDHYLNDTCQFTNTTGHKGFTPGSGQQRVDTGPRQDHTLGSPHGKYLFVDPNVGFDSTSSSLKTVSMTSREFPPSSGYCIYAWYNMYGKDIQDFALYIKVGAGKGYPVISRHGDQGHEWKLAKADLDYEYTSSPFSIEISGTTQAYRLYSYVGGHRQKIWFRNLSKVAVDDIYIYNTRCKNIPVCPRHGITRSFGNQTMCYTFHTQPATWYEAATRCRREGPHFSLVTIKSQEEQMFITRTIKGDPALSAAGQLGFWTAGNDERHEHTFDWTDTGTPYQGTYSNWRAGQPNNFAGDQDCLLLEFPDLDYQWGDQECHERHPYICKSVHPTPSPPTTPPTALIG